MLASFVFNITFQLFSEKSNEERTFDGSQSVSGTWAEYFPPVSQSGTPASVRCSDRCSGERTLTSMGSAVSYSCISASRHFGKINGVSR